MTTPWPKIKKTYRQIIIVHKTQHRKLKTKQDEPTFVLIISFLA